MNTTKRNTRQRKRGQEGFTLIELLLVLLILAVLAAIVVPKVSGRSEQAKKTAAIAQIASFESALDAFEVDNGYYPQGSDGLQLLLVKPADADNWRGPYLGKDIPNDPWGQPYLFDSPGKNSVKGFDIMSTGPDKKKGGGDDITNWE